MYLRSIMRYCIPWRIHGAAIYGAPWIPSFLTPVMLALIYQHQPDPAGQMGEIMWNPNGHGAQLPWSWHLAPVESSAWRAGDIHNKPYPTVPSTDSAFEGLQTQTTLTGFQVCVFNGLHKNSQQNRNSGEWTPAMPTRILWANMGQFPFECQPSPRVGRVNGVATCGDCALTHATIELQELPPDKWRTTTTTHYNSAWGERSKDVGLSR